MDRVPAWHRAHLKNHCHFGSTNRQAALLGKNPDTSCAAWNLQIFSHISLKIGTISTITDGQDVPSTPFLMFDVWMDLLISRTWSALVMARLLSLMACLDPTLWDNRHKLDEKTKTFASEQSQTDDDMTLAFNAGWEWSGQYIGCAKWFTFLLQAFENAGSIVGIFLMPANLKILPAFSFTFFQDVLNLHTRYASDIDPTKQKRFQDFHSSYLRCFRDINLELLENHISSASRNILLAVLL